MTFNWIELAAFILVAVIISILIYSNIKTAILSRARMQVIDQLILDNNVYIKRIAELVENNNKLELAQTDGFVNFISSSRDWAFDYIENVQDSISSLKLAVENGYPTEEEMEKLFSLLPENKENNNE